VVVEDGGRLRALERGVDLRHEAAAIAVEHDDEIVRSRHAESGTIASAPGSHS
jgi:hypothetical protein